MRAHPVPPPHRTGGSTAAAVGRRIRYARHSIIPPSARVEYVYYFVIAYSVLSAYLGVEVPLVAAGLSVALAGFCWQQLGSDAKTVFAPIRFLLACTVSFIVVQMVFHGVSSTEQVIRTFILWICGMIIVQSLCLRQGFVQRCTLVLFAIGLFAVPNLTFNSGASVERAAAGIDLGGNLRNANGLGGWFGFCLVSFAMLGLEAKRLTSRALYWSAAAGCLLIAGLSVSRGALLASALAIIVGFRGLFKRGILPLLLLIILSGVMLQSGSFGHIVSLYEERGMEDTGRLLLWPHVVDRILAAPLVGVGVSNISTYIPEAGDSITTPHNSFLFFALSSGVVPFAFWTLFWMRAGRRSLAHSEWPGQGTFQLPFFVYLMVTFVVGDINIDPWVLLAVAVAAGSGGSRGAERFRLVPRFRAITRRRYAESTLSATYNRCGRA